MIILRNNALSGGGVLSEKTFNSQAQKARRASWDMDQRIGNLSQKHQQQLAQSKAAREAAAKAAKQAEIISPKVKAANFVHGGVTNQTFKPNNTSFIGKMGKFIGNHKVGTAVAGTALATGAGLLAYSHYKNNNNNNNNNNQQ
jgi:hypothetical protein